MKANGNERFNKEDIPFGTSPNDFVKSQIGPLKLDEYEYRQQKGLDKYRRHGIQI